jgi:hypothetical protein
MLIKYLSSSQTKPKHDGQWTDHEYAFIIVYVFYKVKVK